MSRRWSKAFRRSGYEDEIEKDLIERRIPYRYEKDTLLYAKKVRGGECSKCGSKAVLKHGKYLVDFVLLRNKGDVLRDSLFIEAKGRLIASDRTKMIAVKQHNPDLDIRFMFMRKEKLKLKRTPYNTDWAEANGFPYVIGHEVPEEWL